MITAAQVLEGRQRLQLSRKSLAEATGLTEGKVWRIENKGTITDEEASAIATFFDSKSVSMLADPTPRPAPTPAALAQPRTHDGPLPSVVGSIDWMELRRIAAEVGDHEYERIMLGPDPAAGFRLISNSEIQVFKECRRKWWLAYYNQYALRAEAPTGARAIGQRVHRALQAWYVPTGQTRVDPRDALERLIVDDWSRLVEYYGESSQELVTIRQAFNADADLERAMIEGYVQWIGETGVDSELTIVGSEQYLEAVLPLGEEYVPTKIIGKLDVRAQQQTTGNFVFLDHKTVGELKTPRLTLQQNEQMMHYLLLEFLNSSEADVTCDGALYNMLRKVKRTVQAKPPFYDRVVVHHNKHEIQAFRERLLGTVKDMLDIEAKLDRGASHQQVAYPRPSRDCTWKCDFFAVCPMFDDGSRVQAMLDEYYRQRDPLEYYQTMMIANEGAAE